MASPRKHARERALTSGITATSSTTQHDTTPPYNKNPKLFHPFKPGITVKSAEAVPSAAHLMDFHFWTHLMGLPLELREWIYEYIILNQFVDHSFFDERLVRHTNCRVYAEDRHSTTIDALPLPILPDICCVDRQIFQESLPVFIRQCSFILDGRGPTHAFFQLLDLVPGDRAFSSIRDLRIAMTSQDTLMPGIPGVLHLLMLSAPSLQRLELDFPAAILPAKSQSGWQILSEDAILKYFNFAFLERCTNLKELWVHMGANIEVIGKRYPEQFKNAQELLVDLVYAGLALSGSTARFRVVFGVHQTKTKPEFIDEDDCSCAWWDFGPNVVVR
ncbi:hypothetical protein CC80DRAFT_537058 [Byssothecium circinans]|uniref:Uncharacterized protein n=1 Tax=Byssothecium circinans TaxID=147558 RepID=A0A6A5TP67_9PLEO|nr:hypothetical protein CC80DRAFT_537058 [Byssothecium circinans]